MPKDDNNLLPENDIRKLISDLMKEEETYFKRTFNITSEDGGTVTVDLKIIQAINSNNKVLIQNGKLVKK